ncbi:hypothetical protein PUR34_06545 [Streptomyces sp. JV185]|uniref:hypothetical protein n=1 Tax=Streptomyces sp. JV185 TaxID=858638 RepID=UPI002E75F27E|nr:hypothetical protein [Streptomyces sp. JV185]MEE1767847.1 hypothetical protein [Streptomyces sp. JV185]
MSIKATPELNNLLFVLIGERLLQADEDLAYASRRPYHRLADRLTDLSGEIEQSVVGISRSLPPKVGANYLQSMRLFIDNGGTNHLRDFSDQLKTIGDGRTETSMNITESKWQIIAELIRLMIELLIIAVMAFFSGGASASDAAVAKARSRVVLLTVLDTLLKRTHLMPSLSEAFQEAFQTFAVRLAMMAAGPDGRRPKGFDWKAIAQDGVFGAFAGFFHGVFSSGLGKLLKNFTGSGPVKNLTKDVTDKAPRPKTFSAKNLGNTALNDTKDFLTSGGSEAVAEIVAGGLMTGNWTTSWDTFLGSGISSKAESLLEHGAAKPGTWVKNNFAGTNVPTSSRADDEGTGAKPGNGTDSGAGSGAGAGSGNTSTMGKGPTTGAGGASGGGKNNSTTNGSGSQDQTDSTEQTGQKEQPEQAGNNDETEPESTSTPKGSTGPSGSTGPATKGPVNTSGNADNTDFTDDGTNSTDDADDTDEETQQSSDNHTVPPTGSDAHTGPSHTSNTPHTGNSSSDNSRGGPVRNNVPDTSQDEQTPNAQPDTENGTDQDSKNGSDRTSEHDSEKEPAAPTTLTDAENDDAENDTEPSTGLLTEDGTSDTDASPSETQTSSQSQATPHTVTVPEHQLWTQLLGTPGNPPQQLLDDIAAHRRGNAPSQQEIDLRRELHEKLNGAGGGVTIYIDDAANFGHQAAATMLMDSLDELGYKGPITAIAPDSVQQKLKLLLSDDLNARVNWQTRTFDPHQPATDPRASGKPGAQGLVMVAASDRLDDDAEAAERFLNFLGTDRAIVLKPYAWDTSHRYLYSRPSANDAVEIRDLENTESAEDAQNALASDALFNFHTPRLTQDELTDLIDRRVTDPAVAAGLKAVARAVHENGTEVMPVYGLHNVTDSGRVSALSSLAAGITKAGIGKPSVILSFGRTTVDFAPAHTDAHLSRTEINAADLDQRLARLGPDDVLIVQSPGLPQDVFRQVFQLGTLPAVLEGANTTNLMQLLGRPYFSALTHHTPYDKLDPVAADHLGQVTKAITHPSQWGRKAAKLTSEQPTPEWTAFSNVRMAQAVMPSLPKDGEGRVLTRDEMNRLLAKGVLSTEDLEALLGDGDDVKAVVKDPYTGLAVTITKDQYDSVLTRLQELRDEHVAKVRSTMDLLSVVPEESATDVIAEAIGELMQPGSRLHTYFGNLRAKAHEPHNDQTLQALRLALTDRPALPRTESLDHAESHEDDESQEEPHWRTDWDRREESDDESDDDRSSSSDSIRTRTVSRQESTTEEQSEDANKDEEKGKYAGEESRSTVSPAEIADDGSEIDISLGLFGDTTTTPKTDDESEIDISLGLFGDTTTEAVSEVSPAVDTAAVSSATPPPRLLLRSARSADDHTVDSDEIVRQTVTNDTSESSVLASYTQADWAQRSGRFSTVIASTTFQDHHHQESSMYRRQRRLPWGGQKVSFFAAHGTPTRVTLTREDGTTVVISGRELGRYLEHSADLGPKDRPIVLYACSTGASPTHGGLSVAQHVANVTGRPVYAPTTTAGTAIGSDQQIRPVLFRDSDENPGHWISYAPEPSGAELTALARTAGLHPPADTANTSDAAGVGSSTGATSSEDSPDVWATMRTLQLVRTLRGTFGTQIAQSPDHDSLLAALGALDKERFGGDDGVWGPYRDGRMTPDLLHRITEGLSGTDTPGLDRYSALFDRVGEASAETGPAAAERQDDLRSPSHDITQDALDPQQTQQESQQENQQENQPLVPPSTAQTVASTDVVQLVVATLAEQRPATVDDQMVVAPREGAVQQFPGGLSLPTYITGDGTNAGSAFTYGESQVIQRGVDNVLTRIATSALPVPARRTGGGGNNPLGELEQALKQTPHLFHGDGWLSTPFKDTTGRVRQLRVSQRPQAPWSLITNKKGAPITLDPVKVDQIHRSQITSGKSETASSSRQFGISVPLGPPIGPANMFGRVGLTLGFTKSVDFNLQDQTLSQVESRHSDESHLYLGDVMYTVELTDPAPEKHGKLKRITERFNLPGTRPSVQTQDRSAPRITFGVKDGLLLRLPDNLTAEHNREHAPHEMTLNEHSDYRTVHTEGYGSVAEIHAWAVGNAEAVVGSAMHAEITRFFSSENFIRTADRMAHGPVTGQPLFTDSGEPAGVFVVDKVVPGRATHLSGTNAAELRNAIQRVIKNDRSTSTAYSQDLQFTVGPSFSLDEYATSAVRPRVQVAGFTQFGNRSTRTTGFGGSGSRKIVGRAKKVRTELYLVEKEIHVRRSGGKGSRTFTVRTLDRMTRAEARRLAGWDDGTTLRTRSAQLSAGSASVAEGSNSDSDVITSVTPHTGEPLPPVYLPEDRPTLLGMTRLEAFLPDNGNGNGNLSGNGNNDRNGANNEDNEEDSVQGASTAAAPPPPASFLTELTNSVIAAVAEQHPGLVAPLADFTDPADKTKGWRGRNHFNAALQNTLSVMDALSHHSVAGQLESFAADGLRIRLVDITGTKRKYRWIQVKGDLTGRRYEGTRNELILRSSAPGTQRLDSSGTISHTREFGIDVGVSARETNADSFKQPINSGVLTPAGRFAWQKARKTGSGATVSYEPLHATSGPSHVFSYQLSVTVTSGGYWRFREPLRFLGVLGTGLSVGRNAEIDLIGGTARRPAVTGRVLLDVPDEHIPPNPPNPQQNQEPGQEQQQTQNPSRPAPVPTLLSTKEVHDLLDGDTDDKAETNENTNSGADIDADSDADVHELTELPGPLTPFGDLPHQVIAVAGSSELSQAVGTALKDGSGNAWQFSLYGAAPHDAVMRQFQPQVLASFLDQSVTRAGMRMVELFGAGPYVNRIGRLVHRVSFRNPVVQSRPVSVETELTLGAETQVTHAKTSVTVAKLNFGFAYARSHDQGPSLVGTYGLVLNGTWTKGRTATVTNTVSVENDRDDENLKYLVTADIQHEVGFTTKANGLAGPLRTLLPILNSHYAGFKLNVPGGWLGHIPEKTAHRLGLVGQGLPPVPLYKEDSWSPAPWLKDTPFGSFPVNSLDSSRAARDFAELLKSQGVDDAGRDHILDLVSPRALLALRQQMAAARNGVTAVTRTAWTKLGQVSIGSQRATVRIELTQEKTEFDGIDHSVTFQETLGMTETVEVNGVKAVTTTTGFSVTEAVRTQNTAAPTAGPSLSESLAVTQQRTVTTSASRMKNYTFYPNEPFADFLTTYRLRMVLVNSDGTELTSGDFPIGTMREQLPLSLAMPDMNADAVQHNVSSSTQQNTSVSQQEITVEVTQPLENADSNPLEEQNPAPRVTLRRPGQLTTEDIENWRREGGTEVFTMPSNGFMPRRITGTDTALDAAHLAMAKAFNTKLPHLPRSTNPVELTGLQLTEAAAKARRSGLAPQGLASGQALADGLSSTQTSAFFANTATSNGYLAATMHDAGIALDTQGSYRLFSRPRLNQAVLLSVAAEATMESPERQTASSDVSITETGGQSTTLGASVGTSVPSVGSVSPAPTGSGGNTGESGTLKIASADGTQQNIKPKTGRALLFSIPTDWLGEATIAHGKLASVFVQGNRSQVVEYRTNVMAWVREDVARELGLIDDTTFPADVTAAWTSVAAASKAWVDADKAYWTVRRAATESTGDDQAAAERLEQMEQLAARSRDAMREFRRVRAATDRLTQWFHRAPRRGPQPPPVEFTAPGSPSPKTPRFTVPDTAQESSDAVQTLVSPGGDTYTLQDVPKDGDAFFHALGAGLRHTGTPLSVPADNSGNAATSPAGLLGRMTDTLTNDSGDLLDFTTPDLLDTFDPQELDGGGPTFTEGSPEAREFADPSRTLPLYARLSPDERRALALAQLRRPGGSPDDTGWDHGAADLLPALAARTFGVRVTVVRDDGTFQDFDPGTADEPTRRVVLYLKDRHYQAALSPVLTESDSDTEDDSSGENSSRDDNAHDDQHDNQQSNQHDNRHDDEQDNQHNSTNVSLTETTTDDDSDASESDYFADVESSAPSHTQQDTPRSPAPHPVVEPTADDVEEDPSETDYYADSESGTPLRARRGTPRRYGSGPVVATTNRGRNPSETSYYADSESSTPPRTRPHTPRRSASPSVVEPAVGEASAPPPPPTVTSDADNTGEDSDSSSPDVLARVLDDYGVRDIVVRQVNLRPLNDPLKSAMASLDLAPQGLSMRALELTDIQMLRVLAHHRHLSPEAVRELLKYPPYAAILQHDDEVAPASAPTTTTS